MARTDSLTLGRLKEVLFYDPESGEFSWRKSRGTKIAGSLTGNKRTDGYSYIKIDTVLYRKSRLAWFYVHGMWPSDHTDHINGNTSDDRIVNLRPATCSQNLGNRKVANKGSSGHKGIHFDTDKNRFLAYISCQTKRYFLGGYISKKTAQGVYLAASRLLFGEFSRDGEIEPDSEHFEIARRRINGSLHSRKRAIRCRDLDVVFASMSDAARSIGMLPTSIHQAIRTKGRASGLRFEYAEY